MAASEAVPDATGTVLNGEYELIGPMPGESSAVYEAQRRSNGQRVAVRLLRGLGPAASAVAAERARRAVTVRHPCLAAVLDHGSCDDGALFVVSEYIDGTPLDEWADAVGIPPLYKVVDFVHQLCLALQVARRHGLTHEFISPSNILILPFTLGASGRVAGKLLDLGITAASRQVTPAVASALFMAPEQLADLQLGTFTGKQTSPAANVYSAGALLYHLSTGGAPYRAGSLRALAGAQAEQPLVRPSRINPAIPAPLDEIILRALSVDPSNRYPSVAELAEALAFIVARTQSVAGQANFPDNGVGALDDEPETHQVPLPPGISTRGSGRRSSVSGMEPLPHMDSDQTARRVPLSEGSATHLLRPKSGPPDRAGNSQAPRGLFSSGPPTTSGHPRLQDEDAGDAVDDSRETLSRPPPSMAPAVPSQAPARRHGVTTQGMPAARTVPPPSHSSRPATTGISQSIPTPRSIAATPPAAVRSDSPAPLRQGSGPRATPPPVAKAPSIKAPPAAGLGGPVITNAPRPIAHGQAAPISSAAPGPRPEPETVYAEEFEDPRAHSPVGYPGSEAPERPGTGAALERIKLDVIIAEEEPDDDAVPSFAPPMDGAAYAPYIPAPNQPSFWQRAQVPLLALLLVAALGGVYAIVSKKDTNDVVMATAGNGATSADDGAPGAAVLGQDSNGQDREPDPTPLARTVAPEGHVSDGQAPTEATPAVVGDEDAPSLAPASTEHSAGERQHRQRQREPRKRASRAQAAADESASPVATPTAAMVESPAKVTPQATEKTSAAAPVAAGNDPTKTPARAETAAPVPTETSPAAKPVAAKSTVADQASAQVAAQALPKAPPAPLKGRANIAELAVRGSLNTSVVKRAVDRAQSDFSACYMKAARAAGKNGYGAVSVGLEVDLRGRTRNVTASGGALPGLASCVKQAANNIATNRAPDTGTVHANFKVNFTP